MPACHAGGRGFESRQSRLTENPYLCRHSGILPTELMLNDSNLIRLHKPFSNRFVKKKQSKLVSSSNLVLFVYFVYISRFGVNQFSR